jgi:hypothetical protein
MKIAKKLSALLAVISLSACATMQTPEDGKPSAQQNPFLDDIPADTPVVSTSIARPEKGTIEAWSKTIRAVLHKKAVQSGYQQAVKQLDKRYPKLHSYLQKQGLIENPTDYTRLGIPERPFMAFYLAGATPILRVELNDNGPIKQLLTTKPIANGLKEVGSQKTGTTYELRENGTEAIFVHIGENELVVGGAPSSLRDPLLAYIEGEKRPGKTLAQTGKLQSLTNRYGFEPQTITNVDFEALSKVLLAPGQESTFSNQFAKPVRDMLPPLTSTCKNEIRWFTKTFPRAIAGTTEYDEEVTATKNLLVIDRDKAKQLKKTTAPTIGADAQYAKNSLLSESISLNIKEVIGVAKSWAKNLEKDPFECSYFTGLNQLSSQLKAVNKIPLAARSIYSLNLLLRDIEYEISPKDKKAQSQEKEKKASSTSLPTDFRPNPGVARSMNFSLAVLIGTEDPESLLSFGQMFAAKANVPVGKIASSTQVVELPVPGQLRRYVSRAYAKRGKSGLGLITGDGASENIGALVDSKSKSKPIFSIRMDLGSTLRRFVEEGIEAADKIQQGPGKYASVTAEEARQAKAALEKLGSVAPEGAAPSQTSLKFTEDGFAIKSKLRGEWSVWKLVETFSSDDFLQSPEAILKVFGFLPASKPSVEERPTTIKKL